jgi:predicted DNA-binding transcriptional regulator AlpA
MPQTRPVFGPLVGRRQLAVMLGRKCSRTVDRLELSDPTFPVRVAVGNSFAYRVDEVLAWIDSRPRAPRATVVKKAAT